MRFIGIAVAVFKTNGCIISDGNKFVLNVVIVVRSVALSDGIGLDFLEEMFKGSIGIFTQ